MEVVARLPGCHVCYGKEHFLIDCPLLSTEVRQRIAVHVTGPNTLGVVSTHSGYSSVASNLHGVLFGTLSSLYFQQNTSPYISHDTDTIMTPNDTGGIEIVPDHSVFCKH